MPGNALKANIYYGDILLGSELEVKDFSLDKFIVFYNEPMPVATDLIIEINSDESPVKGSAVVIKAVEGEKDNTPFMEIRWVEIADENLKVLNSVAEKASVPVPPAVENEVEPEPEPDVKPADVPADSNEDAPIPEASVPDVENIDTTIKIELNQEPETEPEQDVIDNEASSESDNSETDEAPLEEQSSQSPESESQLSEPSDEISADQKEDEPQAPQVDGEEGVLPDADGNGEEKPDDSKVTGDGASEDDKPVKKKVRRRTKKS